MRKLVTAVVAAAAIAMGSNAASAAVIVTVPTPAVYTPPTSGGLIGQVAGGGSGTDVFTFNVVGSAALFSGQLSNTSVLPDGSSNIDFSNFMLDGVGGLFSRVTPPGGAAETWACCQPGGNGAILLGIGEHTLTFTATNTSTVLGTYSGNFNFALAPVPEPATWAMMLLGFAGIGLSMRGARRDRHVMSVA